MFLPGRPSGPVHSGKRRSSEAVQSYEKVPRKMMRMEQKEVIHLLPIKDRSGVIPQSIERGKPLRILRGSSDGSSEDPLMIP